MTEYAHPEVLVSTQWVADRLNDPSLRIVESNEDILLYDLGHIPGAVQIDWQKDLNDAVRRDYLTRPDFEALMAAGLSRQDVIHLENLSDPEVLAVVGRPLQRHERQDAVAYTRALARRLAGS